MKLDDAFDPTSDEFALPDKLLDRTEKLWPGLKRVAVEKKHGKSWKKINGFSLDANAKGEPDASAENVATMVVAIAAHDVESEGEEGTYRARFVRELGGKEEKKTFSFKQSFGDATENVIDTTDTDVTTLIGMVLNQQAAFITIQNQHVENLNSRVLELSTASTKQIEQLLRTNEKLVEQYYTGLAMQANSMTLMLDVERNLEADRQRGQNTAKLLDILKLAAPVAFQQFGSYLKKKAGVEDDDAIDTEVADTPADAPVDAPTTAPADTRAGTPADAELRTNLRERPITTFAHAFRDSITSEQWLGLSTTLTQAQLKHLRNACMASDDQATADAIIALYKSLVAKPENLIKLGEILNETQVQMVMKLNEHAEAHAAKVDAQQ